MRKFASLLFVFVLFAIAVDCSRLGRVSQKFKEVDMKPLGPNEKMRPIEKAVKSEQPKVSKAPKKESPNVPVKQPAQPKKESPNVPAKQPAQPKEETTFVQMKSCCTKSQLGKKMMKCNCH